MQFNQYNSLSELDYHTNGLIKIKIFNNFLHFVQGSMSFYFDGRISDNTL